MKNVVSVLKNIYRLGVVEVYTLFDSVFFQYVNDFIQIIKKIYKKQPKHHVFILFFQVLNEYAVLSFKFKIFFCILVSNITVIICIFIYLWNFKNCPSIGQWAGKKYIQLQVFERSRKIYLV